MNGLFAFVAKAWPFVLAMPVSFQAGLLMPVPDYELREDLWPELREEGTNEVRDGP